MKTRNQSQPQGSAKAKTAKRLADHRLFQRALGGLSRLGTKRTKKG